jgi:hypothetical protein
MEDNRHTQSVEPVDNTQAEKPLHFRKVELGGGAGVYVGYPSFVPSYLGFVMHIGK